MPDDLPRTGPLAWLDLVHLLLELYDAHGLRLLARYGLGEPGLEHALPGPPVSDLELAHGLVTALRRHHGAPPEAFWTYLRTTRAARVPLVESVRRALLGEQYTPAPPPEAAPAERPGLDELTIPLLRASQAEADLVEIVGDLQHAAATTAEAALLRRAFAEMSPRRTNGLTRTFRVKWDRRALHVHAVPSLFRGGLPEPVAVSLAPPCREPYLYYPCGRSFRREGSDERVVYRVELGPWSASERSLVFCSGDARIRFLFNREGGAA